MSDVSASHNTLLLCALLGFAFAGTGPRAGRHLLSSLVPILHTNAHSLFARAHGRCRISTLVPTFCQPLHTAGVARSMAASPSAYLCS
eukprot:scaffold243692_cov19-Tisochrysis_lutea.AAC.1